jgi:hypothetical protein
MLKPLLPAPPQGTGARVDDRTAFTGSSTCAGDRGAVAAGAQRDQLLGRHRVAAPAPGRPPACGSACTASYSASSTPPDGSTDRAGWSMPATSALFKAARPGPRRLTVPARIQAPPDLRRARHPAAAHPHRHRSMSRSCCRSSTRSAPSRAALSWSSFLSHHYTTSAGCKSAASAGSRPSYRSPHPRLRRHLLAIPYRTVKRLLSN